MIKNEEWEKMIYLAHGGSGSGASALDPLPLESASLLDILESGAVVVEAQAVVTEAVTGSTAVTLGDSVDPDGYVAALDITLGTPGAYAGAGALLPDYAPADKSVELVVTGASTAGAMVMVMRGYRV